MDILEKQLADKAVIKCPRYRRHQYLRRYLKFQAVVSFQLQTAIQEKIQAKNRPKLNLLIICCTHDTRPEVCKFYLESRFDEINSIKRTQQLGLEERL